MLVEEKWGQVITPCLSIFSFDPVFLCLFILVRENKMYALCAKYSSCVGLVSVPLFLVISLLNKKVERCDTFSHRALEVSRHWEHSFFNVRITLHVDYAYTAAYKASNCLVWRSLAIAMATGDAFAREFAVLEVVSHSTLVPALQRACVTPNTIVSIFYQCEEAFM